MNLQKTVEQVTAPSGRKLFAETLYKSRSAATVKWLDRRDSGHYTMQVMALTSGKSKIHLLEFLDKDEYRGEVDKFYFFKKETTLFNSLCFLW